MRCLYLFGTKSETFTKNWSRLWSTTQCQQFLSTVFSAHLGGSVVEKTKPMLGIWRTASMHVAAIQYYWKRFGMEKKTHFFLQIIHNTGCLESVIIFRVLGSKSLVLGKLTAFNTVLHIKFSQAAVSRFKRWFHSNVKSFHRVLSV